VRETVTVHTTARRDTRPLSINTCDYRFTKDKIYLVFAYDDSGRLQAYHCTPTSPVEFAEETLTRVNRIAPGRLPTKGTESEDPSYVKAKASAVASTVNAAASAADRQAGPSSVRGNCGLGGRLYSRTSPRTRKIAWVPPTLVCRGS